jgi:hypothetical protein
MSKRFARYTVAVVSILAFGTLVSATPATAVAATPPDGPVFSNASVTVQKDARQWAVNRPTRGAQPSAVRKAATFPPSIRSFAACVIHRESKGTLDQRQSGSGARNGSSSAQGRWQFLNNDWQHSLPWHVRDRLVQFGMSKAEANKVRRYLDRREIATWDGLWQDIGFIETMERGGKFHWNPTHAGTGC